MDPNANYQDWLDAIRRGDEDTAADLAEALGQWLNRGGCAPAWDDDQRRDWQMWCYFM